MAFKRFFELFIIIFLGIFDILESIDHFEIVDFGFFGFLFSVFDVSQYIFEILFLFDVKVIDLSVKHAFDIEHEMHIFIG